MLFQVYDENDPRRARFVGRQKEVKLHPVWKGSHGAKGAVDSYNNLLKYGLKLGIDRFTMQNLEQSTERECLLQYRVDYNAVCFQVNKNFAIKLVAEEPVSGIEARVVSCDGGGGALGHPKVYINLVIISLVYTS